MMSLLWPSMIQRFGRCNRGGEYKDAEVRWIDVQDDPAPYTDEDLEGARVHLLSLKDVGPGALAKLPQTPGAPEPPVLRDEHEYRRSDASTPIGELQSVPNADAAGRAADWAV